MESKDYVLVNKPYDGGPLVCGPYTYPEADALLKAGAAKIGKYKSDCGYWSKLPCWWLDDTQVWLMRRLINFDLDAFAEDSNDYVRGEDEE